MIATSAQVQFEAAMCAHTGNKFSMTQQLAILAALAAVSVPMGCTEYLYL